MALITAPVVRPPSAAPSRRSPSSRVGPAVCLVVAIAWFVALAATGSSVGGVAKWCAAVLAAILVPGFVLVRVSRNSVAPLVEDLGWAAPAGCLMAMLGWFSDRVLPFSAGAYGLGPAVSVLALLVPWSRRKVLARPAPGWGARPALVLGFVQFVALGWMLQTGLLAYRPDPGSAGTTYYPDLMYNLSLVGQLHHHLNPTYPPVAGATLSYHWFLFAITSHLTTHTGVGVFDATLRLGPASIVPAILILVAVVARRLANRVWAGPLAAVLLGSVELSQASRWSTEDGSLGMLPRAWFTSTPQNLGWLAGLAAAGTVIAFLRRAPEDRAIPVALLVPFLILAAGSKSPELVVIVAGLCVALLIQTIRRDWVQVRRCLLGGVLAVGVFGAASITIYRGSSYGLRLQWLGAARDRVGQMFPRSATGAVPNTLGGLHYSQLALLTETALWVVPLLPRVSGLLFHVRYRAWDSAGWFCLGTTVAGFVLALVLRHPAGSEVYFMQSGYPIGVAGAAAGISFAAARVRSAFPTARWRRRLAALLGGLVLLGLASATAIAVAQPRHNPLVVWQHTHPGQLVAAGSSVRQLAWHWLQPMVLLICVVLAGSTLTALLIRRRVAARCTGAPLVWLSALCIALGAGVFTMVITFHGTTTLVQGSRAVVRRNGAGLIAHGALPTRRDAFAAGSWVNTHAGVNDVVATNMYCRFDRVARRGQLSGCDARNFVAAALTQRSTLVGGWAYSDRAVSGSWSPNPVTHKRVSYKNQPFWDTALFNEQFNSVAHPTVAILNDLYRHHHVRWIFVDLRDGPVDVATLDQLAISRFVGPSTEVWQLKTPADSDLDRDA